MTEKEKHAKTKIQELKIEPVALKKWRQAGNYFKFRNHKIFYQDAGEGEVLVCVHGFPTSSWDWAWIWRGLTNKFRVIAPDMLGFGYSDKPKKYHYSILDQAVLFESLLKLLDITNCHLLAHDYGDTVTQEILARHEEGQSISGAKIHSVCFLNGGLFPESQHPRLMQKLLLGPFGSIIGKLVTERSFRRTFCSIFGPKTKPSEEELRNFWMLINYNKGRLAIHEVIQYMKERKKYRSRWLGVLQKTKIPLRLINGPVDPVTGAHLADRYRELIPNPDIVLLENIGHYPQVEDPEGVLRAYFEFVSPHLEIT